MKNYKLFYLVFIAIIFISCGDDSDSNSSSTTTEDVSSSPNFNTGFTIDTNIDTFVDDSNLYESNNTGTLDLSFADKGYITHAAAAGHYHDDMGYSIAIDSSDNVYVAGASHGSEYDLVIWKYKSDGTLDTSFGSEGIVHQVDTSGVVANDLGFSIKLDSSGNIFVSGVSAGRMTIWKYKSDGTLDLDFANTGYIIYNSDYSQAGKSLALDSSGNIYVTGYTRNDNEDYDMTIWKYKSDGTLDTSFNSSGIVTYDSLNGHDIGYSIALDLSGSIYVTGQIDNGYTWAMAIWKYNSDGTLNGIVNYDNSNDYDAGSATGRSIVLDSSGNIYVTGDSYDGTNDVDMVIWKYKYDGTLDTSFGSNGIVMNGGSRIDKGYSIIFDADKNIYIAGEIYNSYFDMAIWKYKSDGTIDTSFGTDGFVLHHSAAGGAADEGYSLIMDSSGSIYVTGYSNGASYDDMVIWKYK